MSGNPVPKHRTTKPADALAKPGGRSKGFILRPYQQELIDHTGAALKAKRSPGGAGPGGDGADPGAAAGAVTAGRDAPGAAQGGVGTAKLGGGQRRQGNLNKANDQDLIEYF